MHVIRLILFVAILVFPLASGAIDASEYGKRPQNFDATKYSDQISKIEQYLSSFSTMYARFMQHDSDGLIKKGYIYISRPGLARWEYKIPTESFLVVRDKRILYYDKELNQASYDDLPEIPLKILLQKDLKLSDDVKVVDFSESDKSMTVTLAPAVPANEESARFESLSFVFAKEPFRLSRIHRTDQFNQTTTLELFNLEFDTKLDDSLFSLADPSFLNKKKKN